MVCYSCKKCKQVSSLTAGRFLCGEMTTNFKVDWHDAESITSFVLWCVDHDCMDEFYNTRTWRRTRRAVLELDHHECQLCRAKGRVARASVAHHVNYLKARPDLALCIWLTNSEGVTSRNILSLCKDCHEAEHDRQAVFLSTRVKQAVTLERW